MATGRTPRQRPRLKPSLLRGRLVATLVFLCAITPLFLAALAGAASAETPAEKAPEY